MLLAPCELVIVPYVVSVLGHTEELPDLGLDVTLRLHEHVDDRALVDVLAEDVLGDAALEQLAAFIDLVGHHVEQVVVRDAFEDLVLVIEREVRSDRTRELPCTLGIVDQGSHTAIVGAGLRAGQGLAPGTSSAAACASTTGPRAARYRSRYVCLTRSASSPSARAYSARNPRT